MEEQMSAPPADSTPPAGEPITAAGTQAGAPSVTATATEADRKRTKMSKVMVGTGGAIVLGSVLPWATAVGESASGLSSSMGNFGWATLICGVLLALYGAQGLRKDDPRVRNNGGAIAAISVSAFVAFIVMSAIDTVASATLGTVSVGAGLIVVLLASLFAIWPLVVLRKDEMERRFAERAVQPASAAWHADPTGRFDQRYHDGTAWTEHVVRGGEQSTDPIHGPTPA